ncbi:Lipopolysaccharide-assembly [Parafilimonas terrae]|uniref:Lipopolysaccharide-assembly n=2 Tax=Parafilimonas terrae TaxID=1465490 RepID=A0A1I5S1M0_9BACT|nr:Lipopolysaccharide-assembly [Parafilimonas terrae]
MILMNKRSTVNGQQSTVNRRRFSGYGLLTIVCGLLLLPSCGIYTFRDVSIDYSKFKTVKVGFLENKARYVNPQLSPKLTDNLKQKINNYTKLALVNGDDASYIITGYVSRYDVSLSAISNQTSAGNRLTVAANITVLNTVDNKTDNFTVSRDFDFSATQSLQQAEGQLLDDIITQLTDQIFNHIFSNW